MDARLSLACSRIARFDRELSESLSDPFTLGSDCESLIVRAEERELSHDLAALGYADEDAVVAEARLRTSDRWVHFNLGR